MLTKGDQLSLLRTFPVLAAKVLPQRAHGDGWSPCLQRARPFA